MIHALEERLLWWLTRRWRARNETEGNLREAAIFANRQIDQIRLGVLQRYPSGRGDVCPPGSRCYEVRSLMSAVIRATEDLRRETGMYDGCPNIMPPPEEWEGLASRVPRNE